MAVATPCCPAPVSAVHAGLAHALDEQCLPDRIIDLMGTGVTRRITLEEHSGVESGAFLDAFGESRRLGER